MMINLYETQQERNTYKMYNINGVENGYKTLDVIEAFTIVEALEQFRVKFSDLDFTPKVTSVTSEPFDFVYIVTTDRETHEVHLTHNKGKSDAIIAMFKNEVIAEKFTNDINEDGTHLEYL